MSTNLNQRSQALEGNAEDDFNLQLAHRGVPMGGDENAKHSNIHTSHDPSSGPFHDRNCFPMFGNDGDSVDDDLHQQLDLEHPKEEDEEQYRNAVTHSVSHVRKKKGDLDRNILRGNDLINPKPTRDHHSYVGDNLAPYHVDVGTSKRVSISLSLFDGLPCRQETKPDGEAKGHGSDGKVTL